MNIVCIALVSMSIVIVVFAIVSAYLVGHRVGYWKRVKEEKDARGIW